MRGVCSRATSSSSPLGSVAAAAPVDEDDSDDDTHLSVYKVTLVFIIFMPCLLSIAIKYFPYIFVNIFV